MPSSNNVIVLALSILSVYSIGLYFRKKRSLRTAPYPPGPRGYPIIHNLLDIPSKYPWVVYAELAEKYGMYESPSDGICAYPWNIGDMIFLRAFGQPLLVLNSPKRISDLLDKRSIVYSGRPYSTMMIELCAALFLKCGLSSYVHFL
jgi:hypothetical protein